MKKTIYISPLLKQTTLAEELPIAESNIVSGDSIEINPSTMEDGSGGDAVKYNSYSVWDDDWSK